MKIINSPGSLVCVTYEDYQLPTNLVVTACLARGAPSLHGSHGASSTEPSYLPPRGRPCQNTLSLCTVYLAQPTQEGVFFLSHFYLSVGGWASVCLSPHSHRTDIPHTHQKAPRASRAGTAREKRERRPINNPSSKQANVCAVTSNPSALPKQAPCSQSLTGRWTS